MAIWICCGLNHDHTLPLTHAFLARWNANTRLFPGKQQALCKGLLSVGLALFPSRGPIPLAQGLAFGGVMGWLASRVNERMN